MALFVPRPVGLLFVGVFLALVGPKLVIWGWTVVDARRARWL